MGRFVAPKLLTAIVVAWVVATTVFFAMRLIPADPAEVVLGDQASAESLAAFRERTGLDRPLGAQYLTFLKGLSSGDLGNSLVNGRAIGPQIADAVPDTLSLALGALLVGAAIGVPLGIAAAVRRNTWVDVASRVFALLGFSFPSFYLGVLLLIVLSVWLGWFPVVHNTRDATPLEYLHKLALPAFTLGLVQAAYITRLTRATMLESLAQDYIRTAVAKGLAPWRVYFKHALRNVLIPVITAVGLYTGTTLGGAVLIETVFSRPGLGRLLIGAIAQRDYNMIQSGLIVFSLVIVTVNLLVDLSYGLLDPRVRHT
jgi:ABC-type dipeptide/oligopeptide/nickel transport system permease component